MDKLIISILKYVVTFILGIITSLIATRIISKSQKGTDEMRQRELLQYLYAIWGQNKNLNNIQQDVLKQIDVLTKDKTLDNQMVLLLNKFNEIDERLKESHKKLQSEEYVKNIVSYKVVADAWADRAINSIAFEIIDENGEIDLERISKMHKKMFPKGYSLGGKLREKTVAIQGKLETRGKGSDPIFSSYKTNLVKPENIHENIVDLINQWNTNIPYLFKEDLKSQVFALAHFHQQFLVIHPFLDGNGRIARIILNEQASYLTDRKIVINIEKKVYIEALHLADLKELERLSQLIENEIVSQL